MTSAERICYTLINPTTTEELVTETQIKADIEQNDVKIKAEALKKLIIQTLNGEKYGPGMAIHVIKYLLPSQVRLVFHYSELTINSGSRHQKTFAHLLGNRAQGRRRGQIASRDDPRL